MSDSYKEEYKEKLGAALEFQDWIQDQLYDRGISVGAYSSRKYQFDKGENRAGIEIKYDRKWRETGNIYIETAEKAHPSRPNFTASGIYRDDNTWLYVIGDYSKAFVFAKRHLLLMHSQEIDGRHKYKRKEIATSQGFLVPVADAERYAAKVIETNGVKTANE